MVIRFIKQDEMCTHKLILLFLCIANLDNGKVIHLVIRPVDAPHNPLNGKLCVVYFGGQCVRVYTDKQKGSSINVLL